MTAVDPDAAQTAPALPPGFDFTDPELNERSIPHERVPRRCAVPPRCCWVEQEPGRPRRDVGGVGTGYWAVSKHADVAAVSKDSKNFSTAENGAIIRFKEGMHREQVELQRVMLINQDPPEHTATRHIISRGFTPRAIATLDEVMKQRAEQIVARRRRARARATSSRRWPRAAAPGDRRLASASRRRTAASSSSGPTRCWPTTTRSIEVDPDVAAAEILGYAMMLAADRKANPRDDIVTKLVHADKDGRGLNDDEFGYFVIMLTVAGNETTRNAITHGMNAFLDHPDQWELWKRERPATMVDEVIRWATPVSVLPAHRAQRRRGRRRAGHEGPAGRAVLRQRELRRGRLRRPLHLRHHPRPQPARRLRRPRGALLHRRQPGPPGGAADVRRPRRPRARHHQGRPSPAGCAPAGSTASRSSRSGTADRFSTAPAPTPR